MYTSTYFWQIWQTVIKLIYSDVQKSLIVLLRYMLYNIPCNFHYFIMYIFRPFSLQFKK